MIGMFISSLLIICFVLYVFYNMLMTFALAHPLHFVYVPVLCFLCDDHLLVGADGTNPGGRSDGGSGAA